ncbi:EamA family transporter [Rathayibacter soli]|uniref:EamA family transporter n=1 Tax=Rathayibacter soli TaxID=3144168 RepID=UPI0027E3D43C|nr:EamA family transporter [Glaciibacter superstes]
MIVSAGIALASAVIYGISDFFGGIASRRIRVLPTTTTTYLVALVVLLLGLLATGGTWSAAAVLAGSQAGGFALVGFLAFYAAIAIGPMSLVSPVIAMLEAVVPVAVAVVIGERLTWWVWLSIVLVVVSGVLVSLQRSERAAPLRPKTAALTLVAGIALGLSIVALNGAPRESRLIPGIAELVVGLLLLLVVKVLVTSAAAGRWLGALLDDSAGSDEPATPVRWRGIAIACLGGLLLGVANILLIFALQSGSLAVVGVLVSLYPVTTIVIARLVLKETMAPVQVFGVVLAILASASLTLS